MINDSILFNPLLKRLHDEQLFSIDMFLNMSQPRSLLIKQHLMNNDFCSKRRWTNLIIALFKYLHDRKMGGKSSSSDAKDAKDAEYAVVTEKTYSVMKEKGFVTFLPLLTYKAAQEKKLGFESQRLFM